jgi:hypothetical protein
MKIYFCVHVYGKHSHRRPLNQRSRESRIRFGKEKNVRIKIEKRVYLCIDALGDVRTEIVTIGEGKEKGEEGKSRQHVIPKTHSFKQNRIPHRCILKTL